MYVRISVYYYVPVVCTYNALSYMIDICMDHSITLTNTGSFVCRLLLLPTQSIKQCD